MNDDCVVDLAIAIALAQQLAHAYKSGAQSIPVFLDRWSSHINLASMRQFAPQVIDIKFKGAANKTPEWKIWEEITESAKLELDIMRAQPAAEQPPTKILPKSKLPVTFVSTTRSLGTEIGKTEVGGELAELQFVRKALEGAASAAAKATVQTGQDAFKRTSIISHVGSTPRPAPVSKPKEVEMKVFIVHGHDDALKHEVARFIKDIGLTPIILSEQANSGKTIIEKIEEYTDVSFGVVLYTGDDEARSHREAQKNEPLKSRARQNVVLEHGYLMAKLGRSKVAVINKGVSELPGDIHGMVYSPGSGSWKTDLVKEFKKAGMQIDSEKFIATL